MWTGWARRDARLLFLLSQRAQPIERRAITPRGTPTPAPIATSLELLLVIDEPVLGVLVSFATVEEVSLDPFTKFDRAATPGMAVPLATVKGVCGKPLTKPHIKSPDVLLVNKELQQNVGSGPVVFNGTTAAPELC